MVHWESDCLVACRSTRAKEWHEHLHKSLAQVRKKFILMPVPQGCLALTRSDQGSMGQMALPSKMAPTGKWPCLANGPARQMALPGSKCLQTKSKSLLDCVPSMLSSSVPRPTPSGATQQCSGSVQRRCPLNPSSSVSCPGVPSVDPLQHGPQRHTILGSHPRTKESHGNQARLAGSLQGSV